MYYMLTEAVKRRFVLELRDYFSTHGLYHKITPNIRMKYHTRERPQIGIILQNSSANKVSLAADNYLGTIRSFVSLHPVEGSPGSAIEWVRENTEVVRGNGGLLPASPGYYFLEVVSHDAARSMGTFELEGHLDILRESVLVVGAGPVTTAQLQEVPIEGTLSLYEEPGYQLVESIHYTVDYSTGIITFINPNSFLAPSDRITADYRYSSGVETHTFYEMSANDTAIPGAILAFGRNISVGDQQAVRVDDARGDTALAYGGKWELSLDFEFFARDSHQLHQITDEAMMFLWAKRRSALSAEGLEITDVNMGGEGEEEYNETEQSWTFTTTVGVSLLVDWEIHVPLTVIISRVALLDANTAAQEPGLSDDQVAELSSGLNVVTNLDQLRKIRAVLAGRNFNFERII